MRHYTFIMPLSDHEEALAFYSPNDMDDIELEITYYISEGSVNVCKAEMRQRNEVIDVLPVIYAFGGLKADKVLRHACEMDQIKRGVGKMYSNYPELAQGMSADQKSEILKLK